jgi:hypothetical protein
VWSMACAKKSGDEIRFSELDFQAADFAVKAFGSVDVFDPEIDMSEASGLVIASR